MTLAIAKFSRQISKAPYLIGQRFYHKQGRTTSRVKIYIKDTGIVLYEWGWDKIESLFDKDGNRISPHVSTIHSYLDIFGQTVQYDQYITIKIILHEKNIQGEFTSDELLKLIGFEI